MLRASEATGDAAKSISGQTIPIDGGSKAAQ
jgi:hypothetical protein